MKQLSQIVFKETEKLFIPSRKDSTRICSSYMDSIQPDLEEMQTVALIGTVSILHKMLG